jgi:hypothetical protein
MECAYIEFYKMQGHRLTNATQGGEGVTNPSKDAREKLASYHRGKPLPESTKQKISKSLKTSWVQKTPEEKVMHATRSQGRFVSPETRQKHTERLKAQWQDPDYRAARTLDMVGNTHLKGKKFPNKIPRKSFTRMSPTPETCEKMRQAMARYWALKRGAK